MLTVRSRSLIAVLLGVLALAASAPAEAQMRPVSAEAVRVTGRVEALPRGLTQWRPVAVGARFVEGDQVRALAASSADLNLPDGSTIFVAENTRFAVTKLDYDAQSRERTTAAGSPRRWRPPPPAGARRAGRAGGSADRRG